MRQRPTPRRVAVIGSLFVLLVVVISVSRHSLFLPIFLGVFTWLKASVATWLAMLTPKVLLLFAKNGLLIKLRDLIFKSLTEFAVLSHRPWRRRVQGFKDQLVGLSRIVLRRYLDSPLWVRCAVALALLALSAGSTWAALALLIIPQAIVDWLKRRSVAVLQKLGVLRSLDAAWQAVVPEPLRQRWDRYRRWTIGRRQIRAARAMHGTLNTRMQNSRFNR